MNHPPILLLDRSLDSPLRRRLEEADTFEVHTATGVLAAVGLIRRLRPAAILVRNGLPWLSREPVRQMFSALASGYGIPVVDVGTADDPDGLLVAHAAREGRIQTAAASPPESPALTRPRPSW